jgi:hypothetical protein
VQATLGGKIIRRSLDLRSWEAASDLVRGWEASGVIGVVKPGVPTVAEAIAKFSMMRTRVASRRRRLASRRTS